ncbi:MAG: hypothetical protein R6U19_06565 [Bacteroidales bacterium]
MEDKKTTDFKKRENTYRIIIGILVAVILIMGWQLMQTKTEVKTVIVEKENVREKLEEELDLLMEEHEQVKEEYSEVTEELSQRDSVIREQAEEIERLIATQADYHRVRRKLEYLRNSHKQYVQQIDSLFTVNRELKAENVEIREQYQRTQTEKEQISEEKQNLEDKVDIGAMLKAYNVSAKAIRVGGWFSDKEKETDKARRLDKIKVCFTIGENLIAEPGERTVYVRISRPDNQVLYKRSEDFFMFNEEKLQYSLKLDIDYQNKEQYHCLEWEKDEHAKEVMEGTYNVAVFIDDHEVGQTKMILE